MKSFANKLARIQTYILMFLVYFLIIPLFSIIRFWDPLKLKKSSGDSYWETAKELDTSITGMKRLY